MLIAVTTCVLHGPARASDVEDIAIIEQQWAQAVERGDRVFIDRLLHRDYINITAQGLMRAKANVLASAPPPAGSTQKFTDMRVRLHGDAAVVTGVIVFRTSAGAAPMAFSFTDVYVREDGRWQVLSSHETGLAAR